MLNIVIMKTKVNKECELTNSFLFPSSQTIQTSAGGLLKSKIIFRSSNFV